MDILTSENLVLRKFETSDIEQFVEAVRESEKTVGSWLPWWKTNYHRDDAALWFRCCDEKITARSAFDIGIFDKEGGLLLGSVAINGIDAANRIGSLGYWVRESQQGNGYCTEAVGRISEFGFDDLDLSRLEIVVLVDNIASRRVAEKCGAKLECIAENRIMYQGRPSAAAVYSLLP